jgi:ribonuclease HII
MGVEPGFAVDECTAGVDEAGRGPLAGPLVAASVVLGPNLIEGIRDSKTVGERERERLYVEILDCAKAVGVGIVSVKEIDSLNIHVATLLAMQRAVTNMGFQPTQVLIDGRFCPNTPYPSKSIVKGDSLVSAISAASIIAKVTRDRIMRELDAKDPRYGFAQNKGYPTVAHRSALEIYGPSRAHRMSFKPLHKFVLTERQ